MLKKALVATLLLTAGVSVAQAADKVEGQLVDTNNKSVGNVTVTEVPKGVILRVEAQGLTPGWHGMHFHESSACTAPDFKSAGSHVHTADKVVHGVYNPDANDDGDLPNLYVGADGKATVELFSPLVHLNEGKSLPALLDKDGSSLVIHANPDDYKSQPIGGAGDRVACASLKG